MLPVTIRLKEALLQLSRMSHVSCLWVDAVCINQKDDDEKGSQVALMKEIYSKATSVIAWLGPTANESTKAIQGLNVLATAVLINRLHERFPQACPVKQEERAYLRNLFKSLDYGMDASHNIALMPIAALANREWWKRIWTFQEIVLARDFIILCGSTYIRALEFKYAIYGIEILANIVDLFLPRDTIAGILHRCHYVIAVRTAYGQSKGSYPHRDLSILSLLYMTSLRARTCSDARDHIFGLLGIAQDEIAVRIRADYRKSVITIYTEVAEMLISRYGLEILVYCQIPPGCAAEFVSGTRRGHEYSTCTEEINQPDSYPSWVPQWGAELKMPFRGFIRNDLSELANDYRASERICVEPRPLSVHNSRILKCVGASLDEIEVILVSPERNSPPIVWFKAIASMIAESEVYQSSSDKEQAIWRTPCADQVWGTDRDRSTKRRARETDGEKYTQFVNTCSTWSLNAPPPDVLAYVQLIRMYLSQGRRVYATRKGYLGLGPPGIRSGDVVCILATAKVPHVLRRVDSNYHSLVGESYVHCVMDGEYKPANSELRDFMIV